MPEVRTNEARLPFSFPSLDRINSIPKAECNVLLGAALTLGSSLISSHLGWVVVALTVVNYVFNDKPKQDSLVREYFEEVAPYGYRDKSGIPRYNEPRMQKYVKGLSHSFFQMPEGEINENISVIDNAVKLRMFTD